MSEGEPDVRTVKRHGIVGIDGSPASELATAIAFDEASRRGVGLRALHAWSDIGLFELPESDWPAVGLKAKLSLAECLAGWQRTVPGCHGAPNRRL